MYEIRTLKDTSPQIIFETFLQAFTNYFVPVPKDFDSHFERWQSIGVDFSLSYGAFINHRPVAFTLHSPINKTLFNLATGVVPSARGQRLIDKIYSKAIPEIKGKGFDSISLEVISKNTPAIRVYERLGFKMERELLCFKGRIPDLSSHVDDLHYQIGEVKFNEEMRALIKYPYSSEQSEDIISRVKNVFELHEIFDDHKLLAYAIYQPKSASIVQLEATEPFNQNAYSLLSQMHLKDEVIRMNNVDLKNKNQVLLWSELGFENYISQYEMKKSLISNN